MFHECFMNVFLTFRALKLYYKDSLNNAIFGIKQMYTLFKTTLFTEWFTTNFSKRAIKWGKTFLFKEL